MKHAGPAALDALDPLLVRLRGFAGLKETARGVFYRRGRAFLHFHEDRAGLFADLRDPSGADFERLSVNSAAEHDALCEAVQDRLGG